MSNLNLKNGFSISNHARKRIYQRSRFSDIDLLRFLNERRYAKLAYRSRVAKKVNSTTHPNLKSEAEIIRKNPKRIIHVVFLLVYSEKDASFFIIILADAGEKWLVLTILPNHYIYEFRDEAIQKQCSRAKRRMLEGRIKTEQKQCEHERAIMHIHWEHDNKRVMALRNLAKPAEFYMSKQMAIKEAALVTGGVSPFRILIKDRKDCDKIYFDHWIYWP